MIGKIMFASKNSSKRLTAELGDDWLWHCDDKQLEEYLNLRFSIKDQYSPSQGEPGFKQLREAARALGGEIVSLRKVAQSPEDSNILY